MCCRRGSGMEAIMDNYVITIARGFGSGGKAIGLLLSDMLGVPCYDKEILQIAADTSGINESYFFDSDEKVTNGFRLLFKKINGTGGHYKDYPFKPENRKFTSNENLFNFQADVLRHLGKTESCIIIGRASNYILKDYANALHVNIQAPLENCVHETMRRMQIEYGEALQTVQKSDKYRADFYYYYTGEEWNNPVNYDICLNTQRFDYQTCADIIVESLKLRFKDLTVQRRTD